MLIGIKDLNSCYGSIDMPGLFVMTVPAFSLAKSILLQTIIHNPDTKTALISFEKRNQLFDATPEINKKIFDIYNARNLLLNIAAINENKHSFSKIRQNLEKEVFASVDLILIDIEQDIFMSASDSELSTILSSWQSWLVRHKKTCIWVVHGNMATDFIKNKFLNLNNMFNGLANIEFDIYKIKYELVFWHLYSSIQSNILLNLLFDEVNNEISAIESNELELVVKSTLMTSQSNNRVLVVKSEDELQEIFPREWEVVHSFDALENAILGDIAAATVIIYIDANIDINFTVSKIIKLRKNGGGWLKIIVREMEPCLRNVEEKFIINSGANLIVPHSVALSRFITIVYAIQGSYLIRNIPNRVEDIYQVDLNEHGKSYLLPADFVKQVISLVEWAQRIQINSTLLKLSLNRAIPIDEIVALIKINRNGDIFTYTENHLYLFLFQCGQSEIQTVLSQVILLPINDLFLEEELFLYADDIRNEIKNISEKKQAQQKDYEHWRPVMNTLKSEKKSGRNPAISLPLALKIG